MELTERCGARKEETSMKTAGIIPARYGSSRLPGKPLLEIQGMHMVWWVYERARRAAKLDQVWVATDDVRIEETCRSLRIPVVMTGKEHRTAAERLQEAAEQVKADFYVQINGDEPLIDPSNIDAAVPDEMPAGEEFGTNIIAEVKDPVQLLHSSNIKVVFDSSYRALYMSRAPVPCPFSSVSFSYYKHVGIIGYSRRMLDFYKTSVPGRLERIEGIDTLRFLDYGKELRLIPVEKADSLSVDTEADLLWVRDRMREEKRL